MYRLISFFYFRPGRKRSIVMNASVCLYLFTREHLSETTCPIFTSVCACYLRLWVDPPLAAICDTLCTSGLMDDVDCTHWAGTCDAKKGHSTEHSMDMTPRCILKLTHQGAAPDRGWVWKLRLPCFSWVTWAYLVLSAYDAEYCQHSVVCRMNMIFAELVQFKLHRRYRANTTQSGSCRSCVS